MGLLISLIFLDQKEKEKNASHTKNHLFRLINALCRRRLRRDDNNEREEKRREDEQQTKTCDQQHTHSLSLFVRFFPLFFALSSSSFIFPFLCALIGSRIECGANFSNCVLDVFFSHHSFTPLSPSNYTKKQTRNVRNKRCTRCARR